MNSMNRQLRVMHDWAPAMWDWPQERNDGVVRVTDTQDRFEVEFDMNQFTPDEITVNVKNGELLVDAKHQERSDRHGRVNREIHRAYTLPRDVNIETLTSHLNNRGILIVTADRKSARGVDNQIRVNVQK